MHYIAEAKRRELSEKLSKARFFSILMDGSTDSGNIDNEILMIMYCDTKNIDEKVHIKT